MEATQQPQPLVLDEPTIAGPYSLFDGSIIFEFLEPDESRNASVLIRTTFIDGHPLNKTGKRHPFCPPLHLHFDQIETFTVLQGKIGATSGYDLQDSIVTPADGSHEVKTWVPHTFFPVADVGEDSIMLMWAHPGDTPNAMDGIFFRNILLYLSDVHQGKAALDPFLVMLMQHVTATAMVWFPTVTWLGPLRWWVPLKFQGAFAGVARLLGKKPVVEKYTDAKDWEAIQSGKLKAR